MIQLRILSGKRTGETLAASRFPIRVGRAANSDLRVDEPGVWDRHLQLDLDPDQGVVLTTSTDAWAHINGESVQQAVLRNGDLIEIGSLQLQFWLSETRQSSINVREAFTWSLIALVCLAQVSLLYFLLSA
jgi:pSer/pThr/pTyr-binding forkhead associated (FHA) protein